MAQVDISDPGNLQYISALEQSRGLPAGLLPAVMMQESGGNAGASSGKANGLMQFTPDTAKAYNVDVNNAADSLRGAADYLGDLVKQYGGNVQAALAHYNGGTSQGKLVASGATPTFGETAKYVPQVMARQAAFAQQNQPSTPSQDGSQPAQDSAPAIPLQTSQTIAKMALNGGDTDEIFNSILADPSLGPQAADALAAGMPKEKIVSMAGGQPLQDAQTYIDKQGQKGALDRFIESGWEGLKSVGRGANQLLDRVTGDNQALAQDQQEEQQIQADPNRQALLGTTAGKIGNAVGQAAPALALAPFTDGASLLSSAGYGLAGGVGTGALTPTTKPGEFTDNVVSGGVGGLTGGVAGYGMGKALGAVLGKNEGAVARLNALQDAGETDISAAQISPIAQAVNNLARNIPLSGAQDAATVAGRENNVITRGVLRAMDPDSLVGVEGIENLNVPGATKTWNTPITTDIAGAIKSNIKNGYENALKDLDVTVSPDTLSGLAQKLKDAQGNGLLDGISDLSKPQQAITNLTQAAQKGPVSAIELQQLRSAMADLAHSPATDYSNRQVLNSITDSIDKMLNDGIQAQNPNAVNAYTKLNTEYAKANFLQNLATKSGNGEKPLTIPMLQQTEKSSFGNIGQNPMSYITKGMQAGLNRQPTGLAKAAGDLVNKGSHSLEAGALLLHPHLAITAGIPLVGGGRVATGLVNSTNPIIRNAIIGNNALGAGINNPMFRKALAAALATGGDANSIQTGK